MHANTDFGLPQVPFKGVYAAVPEVMDLTPSEDAEVGDGLCGCEV
jgi:hypothetical protein